MSARIASSRKTIAPSLFGFSASSRLAVTIAGRPKSAISRPVNVQPRVVEAVMRLALHQRNEIRNAAYRALRFISFGQTQVASMAQTFTWTSPIGKQMSRMVSSVMSVETFAAFFGQLT